MKNDGMILVHPEVLPSCIDEEGHVWEILRKPSGYRSGYHITKCMKCALQTEYDTSD